MDILLEPSEENGLKKQSIIRISKLATIDKSLALGRLGKLNEENVRTVNHNLKKIFKLDE